MLRYPLCLFALLAGLGWAGEELSLKVSEGTLTGELEVSAAKKKTVALIIPGSGPTDRDGNSRLIPGRNDSLKQVAEALKEGGFDSLRIDKRGIGGTIRVAEKDLRFDRYVADAVLWMTHLKKELGYERVIVIGHSEGALVGKLALEKEGEALVSLCGVGRPARDVISEQLKAQLPAAAMPEIEAGLDKIAKGEVVKPSPHGLDSLFRPSIQPYLKSWFEKDPAATVAKLDCPILVVQGSTDIQVQVVDAEALHEAVVAARGDSRLVLVEGMNHVLKKVKGPRSWQLLSYGNPKLALHSDLMPPVLEFFQKIEQAEAKASSSPAIPAASP